MKALNRAAVGRLAMLALLLSSHAVYGQCQFDGFGTISNPNDPSCRDARFELTESDSGPGRIALGYPPPVPVDSLTGVAGFRSYASLHARHQDLLLTSAHVAGQAVGQSLSGRDIWAYRIGDADATTPEGFAEPAVMLNGTIHAREWQSPEVVTEIFEQLIERADDGGFGQYLNDHLNVVILPVQNVDGFIQTQRFPTSVAASDLQPRDGRMRRKNLRNPSGGAPVDDSLATSADQYSGVDLNRNSRHGFGLNNGSSGNVVSLVYRGSTSSSEPETLALRAAAGLGPAARLRFYTDVHSFTRIFLIPQTGNTRRNQITTRLSNRMRAVSGNRYASGVDPIGAQIGTTADYFALQYDIPSWTLETEPRSGGQEYGGTGASHSGFVLPASQIERVRDELARMMLLGYFHQAGPPTLLEAVIVRRSDNAQVYAAAWVADPVTATRTLQVSRNDGLLAGEGYRLWLAFDKPMRYSDGGQSVSNYPGQAAAAFGVLSLDAGDQPGDLQIPVAGDNSNWLAQAGGAPDGYRRYRFDSLAADFDVPALGNVTGLVISSRFEDLALMRQDADPATPVDFANGHWTGYDHPTNGAGDTGGTDCSFVTFAAPAGNTAPPPATVGCKAAFVAAPPAPTPAPAPAPTGGGGGGASSPWLLALLICLRRERLRPSTA